MHIGKAQIRSNDEMPDISSKHPEVIKNIEEIVAMEHTASPNELFRFRTLGE